MQLWALKVPFSFTYKIILTLVVQIYVIYSMLHAKINRNNLLAQKPCIIFFVELTPNVNMGLILPTNHKDTRIRHITEKFFLMHNIEHNNCTDYCTLVRFGQILFAKSFSQNVGKIEGFLLSSKTICFFNFCITL